MNNQLLDDTQHDGLIITPAGKREILTGAKWAKFLAVVGIIISLLSLFSFIRSGNDQMLIFSMMLGFPAIFLKIFQVLMLLISFLPIWFLFQYANKATVAVKTNDSGLLGEAIRWKKFFYTYYGITVILLFVLGLFAYIYAQSMTSLMPPNF